LQARAAQAAARAIGLHSLVESRAKNGAKFMDEKLNAIKIGYQAYLEEGGDPFGAVRRVAPRGRDEVTIYIENGGDFRVDPRAVKSVHDGKVVLDRNHLETPLLEAIRHAHDREEPGL
jgi:hypothetical protein